MCTGSHTLKRRCLHKGKGHWTWIRIRILPTAHVLGLLRDSSCILGASLRCSLEQERLSSSFDSRAWTFQQSGLVIKDAISAYAYHWLLKGLTDISGSWTMFEAYLPHFGVFISYQGIQSTSHFCLPVSTSTTPLTQHDVLGNVNVNILVN